MNKPYYVTVTGVSKINKLYHQSSLVTHSDTRVVTLCN